MGKSFSLRVFRRRITPVSSNMLCPGLFLKTKQSTDFSELKMKRSNDYVNK
jgi:hypothetical protein